MIVSLETNVISRTPLKTVPYHLVLTYNGADLPVQNAFLLSILIVRLENKRNIKNTA